MQTEDSAIKKRRVGTIRENRKQYGDHREWDLK